MRRWKPQANIGLWIAAALLAVALVGSGVAALRLAQALVGPPERWPINLNLYLWLLALVGLATAALFLAYRLAAGLTLAYELDRNGLYVTWLGNRATVPLDQISTIDIGASQAVLPWPLLQGLGVYWGNGRLSDGRPLSIFASRPLARCLVVHTAEAAYAISPRDQDAFVQDLEQRRSLGPIKHLASSVQRGRFSSYAFWNDGVVRTALWVALLLNLALLAFLTARYPALAGRLPMQFDPAGGTVALRPKYYIFLLPLAALALSMLNVLLGIWLYRREQSAARLLQIASVLIHVLFAVAGVAIVLG